jgi:Flp pilus assembly pilin Flp
MWMRLQVLIGDALRQGATIPAREEGQTLLEYAIVIAVAVLVVLGSIKAFGTSLGNLFNNLIAQVTGI